MHSYKKFNTNNKPESNPSREGILLVDKSKGKTSFSLVSLLRKTTQIRKIGHAGTLDPFATGLMVMLIGKPYTQQSDHFLVHDKEYQTTLRLGIATDTYDCEGVPTEQSEHRPSIREIEEALAHFQGNILQVPPMFSAKKLQGKKLYELARKGITVERAPAQVHVKTTLISYDYPFLTLHVTCSKGTYIRSIGHDLGKMLGCYAHLQALQRLRSGPFHLNEALPEQALHDINTITEHLKK